MSPITKLLITKLFNNNPIHTQKCEEFTALLVKRGLRFYCLPPVVKFEVRLEELSQGDQWRKHLLCEGAIRLPNTKKRVGFRVAVGIGFGGRVYVEVSDLTKAKNSPHTFFYPGQGEDK